MGQVLTQLEREYAKSLNANRTRGCASTQEIISQVEKYKPEDTSLWLGACDLFSKSGWKASLEYNGFDPLDSQFYFTVDQDVVLHST